MKNLIRRYVMNKARDKIDEGVTEDDVQEIKQDVSSFRFELLEILRNNGMKIPDYGRKQNGRGSKSKRLRRCRMKMSANQSSSPQDYVVHESQSDADPVIRITPDTRVDLEPDIGQTTTESPTFNFGRHNSLTVADAGISLSPLSGRYKEPAINRNYKK